MAAVPAGAEALINAITGHIARLQEQNYFSKERLQSFRQYFLLTVGFLVLLYCLIHIQILFFTLLKWIFGLIFKLISLIFWLPLRTARFFIPKSIDYDILFPLFWLCSIGSFYVTKYAHDNICLFYDRQLVRRYRLLRYEPSKREEIRRYLFFVTFLVLLLLQTLFILLPVAQSIRHQHAQDAKTTPPLTKVVKPVVTTPRTPTAKSAVKEAAKSMTENLYNRFVDAFRDENETSPQQKRSPLISDEKLEETLKTIKQSLQDGVKNAKETAAPLKEEKKTSRFQRWVMHYLKAPFQKWESPKVNTEPTSREMEIVSDNDDDDDEKEENEDLRSSSHISDSDDDDEDDDDEESSTLTERVKQRLDSLQDKISSPDDDEDEESSSVQERLVDGMQQVKSLGEEVTKKVSSSSSDDDDDEDEEEPATIGERIRETVSKPIEQLKTTAEKMGQQLKAQLSSSKESDDDDEEEEEPVSETQKKLSSSEETDEDDSEEDDEEHPSMMDRVKENIIKPIATITHHLRDRLPSLTKAEEEEDDDDGSLIDRTKEAVEKVVTPVRDQIVSKADQIQHAGQNLADSIKDSASNVLEKSSEFVKEKAEQIKSHLPNAKRTPPSKVAQVKEALSKKAEQVMAGVKSLQNRRKPKTLTEKAKEKIRSIGKSLKEKLPGQAKKKKSKGKKYSKLLRKVSSKLRTKSQGKLNGWREEAWNVWHLAKNKLTHIFTSSTKHARHLPRYNTTSLYVAYTDLRCFDYTKKRNLYRILKNPHLSFLDSYRHHSPFPVYLSVLKSNGPQCYRHYPDSSCALVSKSGSRTLLVQLYRFVRFWLILGLCLGLGAVIYQRFIQGKLASPSSAHSRGDPDQSTNRKQATTSRSSHPSSPPSTKPNTSSISPVTSHSTGPLNEQIERQLRLWLEHEQNDGFRNLSEICRTAMNQTFQKQLMWMVDGTTHNNTAQRFLMSTDRQAILHAFIERQRDQFHLLVSNLTVYYDQFRSHLLILSEKSNQRYLFLTILLSFVLVTLISLLIFEYRRVFKGLQRCLHAISLLSRSLYVRARDLLLRKSTPPILNILLNSASPIRQKFANELRRALNQEFLQHKERLSVETLQFANAKIRDVSQNNNGAATAEKLIINAVLDLDHLILNIVNTFKEQHFSFEAPKLTGQLYVLLVINPTQYSIEATLRQLRVSPVNIIDPNHALLTDEKQSIGKLIDETIQRTTVRCSFRLADNQENTINESSHSDGTRIYSSSNQVSSYSPTTQKTTSTTIRSRPITPNVYQPSEPPPTLLVNDQQPHLYPTNISSEQEPKQLLVRVVKAVNLHDVEQPYCILELNHPQQTQQTSIGKNGVNPFWDERFLFECDDKSDQIHLRIIDRKTTNMKMGVGYVDSIYADVFIPFSYVTSTVYKKDVQISPQYPESIIRIEFSTLSEEEALAANNGYDVESITDSQTWTYNDREGRKLEQDYPQRYQHPPSTYDNAPIGTAYGLSSDLYNSERDYSSTLPRAVGLHSPASPSSALSPEKPQKSKSFMSSLKHLTLPRRKHHHKGKTNDDSTSSQASSTSQLNISVPTPSTNLAAHSLSSALPGPHPDHFLSNTTDATPIRRSRSISQSFKNLFRSNSKKKAQAAKATDALGAHSFLDDNRAYLSTSTPTAKKLSFLQRRKSKQKAKQQTNLSSNSLSSFDYSSRSSVESMRDTPVRANVGHPVVMTKSLVR